MKYLLILLPLLAYSAPTCTVTDVNGTYRGTIIDGDSPIVKFVVKESQRPVKLHDLNISLRKHSTVGLLEGIVVESGVEKFTIVKEDISYNVDTKSKFHSVVMHFKTTPAKKYKLCFVLSSKINVWGSDKVLTPDPYKTQTTGKHECISFTAKKEGTRFYLQPLDNRTVIIKDIRFNRLP